MLGRRGNDLLLNSFAPRTKPLSLAVFRAASQLTDRLEEANLYMDTNLAAQKNSLGANDVISMFVHMLSVECCTILRTFECPDSLLKTVADKLFKV